jgi:hypothetical protein
MNFMTEAAAATTAGEGVDLFAKIDRLPVKLKSGSAAADIPVVFDCDLGSA